MTYDYDARTVWLDDLARESGLHAYDLCPTHADGLGVPQGWSLTNRRRATVHLLLPREIAV